jgi:hypothetical protein
MRTTSFDRPLDHRLSARVGSHPHALSLGASRLTRAAGAAEITSGINPRFPGTANGKLIPNPEPRTPDPEPPPDYFVKFADGVDGGDSPPGPDARTAAL